MSTGTIAAISTAPGKGGVALIRISGDGAFEIADRVFRAKSGGALSSKKPRTAVYGDFLCGNEIIDSGIATLFAAGASFTGEKTAEFCCHGGILVTTMLLEEVFAAGALPAEPGEFTRRAFLGGRISLSQAEAIGDLLDAQTPQKVAVASSNSRGRLTKELDGIRERLLKLLSSTYAYIDYPDEDLTEIPVPGMIAEIGTLHDRLVRLADGYNAGRAVCEGIPAVILGRPNTGKSSLLNLILGRERAIVTPFAGTTRDSVEETANIGGVMLRLADTAGIRGDVDGIERIGIERAWKLYDESELTLLVFDGSQPLQPEDRSLIGRLSGGNNIIAIINKNDQPQLVEREEIENAFGNAVSVSASDGVGLEVLTERVKTLFGLGRISLSGDAVIANARQYAGVKAAERSVAEALSSLEKGFTQDISALSLEQALSEIDGIDGRAVSEEIVSEIFSKFCVGK